MKILTSYYSRLNQNKIDYPDMQHISISRATPTWAKVDQKLMGLAPTWKMIKMPIVEYVGEYKKILARIDPNAFVQSLDGDCILYCYEKPSDFCHRQMVSDWLRQHVAGVESYEVGTNAVEVVGDDT
jgi:hypothetical protein